MLNTSKLQEQSHEIGVILPNDAILTAIAYNGTKWLYLGTTDHPASKNARLKIFSNSDGSIIANLYNMELQDKPFKVFLNNSNQSNTPDQLKQIAAEKSKRLSAEDFKAKEKSSYYCNMFNHIKPSKLTAYAQIYWISKKLPNTPAYYGIKTRFIKLQPDQQIIDGQGSCKELLIPLFNLATGKIAGVQGISLCLKTNRSVKRNLTSFKGLSLLYPVTLRADFFIIGEGVATCISAYHAIITNYACTCTILCAMSLHNLQNVINANSVKSTPYLLLVDGDELAITTAKNIITNNPDLIIEPLLLGSNLDANDFINLHGDDRFIAEVIKQTNILNNFRSLHNER